MKYISKSIQQYLTNDQKEEYNRIKKQRNEFIRKNPLPEVKMYSTWNNKTWYAVPTRREMWYIQSRSDKQDVSKHFDIIKEFDRKVINVERKALENKEIKICKPGNMLVGINGWWRNTKFLLQEKESRDYYTLLCLDNMKVFSMKWKDIVERFDLSEISKWIYLS